jgi:hypothetical protein
MSLYPLLVRPVRFGSIFKMPFLSLKPKRVGSSFWKENQELLSCAGKVLVMKITKKSKGGIFQRVSIYVFYWLCLNAVSENKNLSPFLCEYDHYCLWKKAV